MTLAFGSCRQPSVAVSSFQELLIITITRLYIAFMLFDGHWGVTCTHILQAKSPTDQLVKSPKIEITNSPTNQIAKPLNVVHSNMYAKIHLHAFHLLLAYSHWTVSWL